MWCVEMCDRLMIVDVLLLFVLIINILLKMLVEFFMMLKLRGLGGCGINSDIVLREGCIYFMIQDDINDDYCVL